MNLGHMTDDYYDPIAPKLAPFERQAEDCCAWGEELDLLCGRNMDAEVEPDGADPERCQVTLTIPNAGVKNATVQNAVRLAGMVMSGKPTEEQRLTELRDAMRALLRACDMATMAHNETTRLALKAACAAAQQALLASL